MSPGPPGHSSLPSDSIKVVPGRSKLRVESINPVPRGNPTHKPSKVKLISSEEAIKLSSGGINLMAVSPPRPTPARGSPEKPQPVQTHPTPEAPKPVLARSTPKPLRPVLANPEAPKLVPSRSTSKPSRTVLANPEALRPVPAHSLFKPSRPVLSNPEAPRPDVPARSPSKPSRPVLANPEAGFKKQIVCGLQALNLTVRRKTTPSLLQYKTVEPPSPRAMQIRSRVKQQAANATHVVQGTIGEVAGTANDHGSKEIRHSISDEELSELLLYRPATHPTWTVRIMDSATPPEFDCEFWARPASSIRRKAHKLSMAMPALLKVEMLPTCHILNDVFVRSPTLLNVEMYLFPDEKRTERFEGDHAHLFEAMANRNAMLKVNINGTDELLILSSKLLDKTSQLIINTQKKTENFLWGFFLRTENSVAIVPGTVSQIDKDAEYGDVVDMDLDTEYTTPSVALKLIAESQGTISTSPEEVNREANLPPGFEKLWTPPSVKLNIQGTTNPRSGLSASAGLVRNESGNWVFGYTRCNKSIPEVAAGLLALYHGLKTLWDLGFRRIRLETTSLETIDALTKNSDLFVKKLSILGLCKDMILKEWECEIYHISKEENSCAEWLASRVEDQPQGFVFFEYPPRGLMDLLSKDHPAAT